MADCYFIGIGGTGSKCVNNYVYSSAAGLGPDRLWIGMVESAPWLRESGLKYIETDAPIDKGNSGGGLYTKTGELIGITSSCKILGGPEECHILDDGSEYCQPYCNLNSPQNWSIPVESFLDLM
ncbi:hypothetical protein OA435_00975 [Pelagibacteraceae bacterium]|nr:hypothetical protein [Pelagibacteraceae bacterium]